VAYQGPTLFGAVYASRLFSEVDEASQAYQAFCKEIEPELNMIKGDGNHHVAALLTWLNRWGCRITKDKFPEITEQLITWSERWRRELPSMNVRLADLSDAHLDVFASAYLDLLAVDEFGPTSAAKTLFATCPHAAMPWDAAIQNGFKLGGRVPQKYREMLLLCRNEAQALIADGKRFGVSAEAMPHICGNPDHTIPWLLDKYHWITITRRHRIPGCEELRRWMGWACEGVAA
jgi:hypothetical protein